VNKTNLKSNKTIVEGFFVHSYSFQTQESHLLQIITKTFLWKCLQVAIKFLLIDVQILYVNMFGILHLLTGRKNFKIKF